MKQTLREMKKKTDITTRSLAECARLSIGDVFAVESGGYTSPEKAQRVVQAFNHLSGMHIRLEDICIHHLESTV